MKNIISNIFIIIYILIIFTGCGDNSKSIHKITLQVIVKNPSENQKVFIAGNQPELGNWKPDEIQLEKIDDSLFSKTFSFKQDTDLEFKITAGHWWLEALDSDEQLFQNFLYKLQQSAECFRSNYIPLSFPKENCCHSGHSDFEV